MSDKGGAPAVGGIGIALSALLVLVLIGGGMNVASARQAASYQDARAYCQAVRTIDEPAPPYHGPAMPDWIVKAVESDDPDSVEWRCADGAVLACLAAYPAACAQMSTSRTPHPAMPEFCRQNPNAEYIPRAGGGGEYSVYLWRCVGRTPVIVPTGSDTGLDARGFRRDDWRVVSPSRPALATSSASVQSSDSGGYLLPVTPVGPVSGFFDPGYLSSEDRQHLGVDLPADGGTAVVSPVAGEVVVNNTGTFDNMKAYLVIREAGTGVEHVLGHIVSTLEPGAKVGRGDKVGIVRPWGSRSHVHWGANSRGIQRSMGKAPEGEWGWGRAPAVVTREAALARGWIDLGPYAKLGSAKAMPSGTPPSAPGLATPPGAGRATVGPTARAGAASYGTEGLQEGWERNAMSMALAGGLKIRGTVVPPPFLVDGFLVHFKIADVNGDGVSEYILRRQRCEKSMFCNDYALVMRSQGVWQDLIEPGPLEGLGTLDRLREGYGPIDPWNNGMKGLIVWQSFRVCGEIGYASFLMWDGKRYFAPPPGAFNPRLEEIREGFSKPCPAALADSGQSQPSSLAQWSLTPQGLGPVKIGMTWRQVSQALGDIPLGGSGNDKSCMVAEADGFDGIRFMFLDNRLSRVSILSPSRVKTPRGIGIGSSDREVIKRYTPGVVSVESELGGSGSRNLFYWLVPDRLGVAFAVGADGLVKAIIAGDRSITFEDGCS